MKISQAMKISPGKSSRSCLHHRIITPLPFKTEPEPRFDILGVATVVSLTVGVMLLMRLLLAH